MQTWQTQEQLKERLVKLPYNPFVIDFQINNINGSDLISLLMITWDHYCNLDHELTSRLNALSLCGTIANLIDDADQDDSLSNLIVQEMGKYINHFTQLHQCYLDEDKH